MSYALISPNEVVEDGFRVAEISAKKFDVADPLFWVDCESDVVSGMKYKDGVFTEPLVVSSVISQEEIRSAAKVARAAAVAAIKVTTVQGHTFDGDEISQGRMARAIIALQETGTVSVEWVLADNTVIQATADELTEALALAGAAQAAIWVIP